MASLAVHGLVGLLAVAAWPSPDRTQMATVRPMVIELVARESTQFAATAGSITGADAAAPAAKPAESRARSAPVAAVLPRPTGPVRTVPRAKEPVGTALPTMPIATAVGSRLSQPAQPALPAAPTLADGVVTDAGGNPDELVRAWLAMHQHYPRAARRHRIEGTVTLAFSLDAHGRVVRAEIDGTSGSRVLDRAALALLGRAEPFPVAATDASTELPFEIEVEYRLASAGLQ
jgi:protein TonB